MNLAVDKINGLLESFLGINDADLGTLFSVTIQQLFSFLPTPSARQIGLCLLSVVSVWMSVFGCIYPVCLRCGSANVFLQNGSANDACNWCCGGRLLL